MSFSSPRLKQGVAPLVHVAPDACRWPARTRYWYCAIGLARCARSPVTSRMSLMVISPKISPFRGCPLPSAPGACPAPPEAIRRRMFPPCKQGCCFFVTRAACAAPPRRDEMINPGSSRNGALGLKFSGCRLQGFRGGLHVRDQSTSPTDSRSASRSPGVSPDPVVTWNTEAAAKAFIAVQERRCGLPGGAAHRRGDGQDRAGDGLPGRVDDVRALPQLARKFPVRTPGCRSGACRPGAPPPRTTQFPVAGLRRRQVGAPAHLHVVRLPAGRRELAHGASPQSMPLRRPSAARAAGAAPRRVPPADR